MPEYKYDIFISHASEDKDTFVRELATILKNSGLEVFYDEWSLTIGDRLRESLDSGLRQSRYGLVVLSPSFFAKHWTQQELDALFALESDGVDRLLPIWHNVTFMEVSSYSPMLADRLAVSTAVGMSGVAEQIIRAITNRSSMASAPKLSVTPSLPHSSSTPSVSIPTELSASLSGWTNSSLSRFEELLQVPIKDDSRFTHGIVTFAYRVLDSPYSLTSVADVRDVMQRAQVHDSGWPPWWVPTRDGIRPYTHQGNVEVWLGVDRDTGAYSDFWRASKDGGLFLVRGFQDDSSPNFRPGTVFDPLLWIIRTMEVFRHVAKMLEVRGATRAEFNFEWRGLRGRTLNIWTDPMRGRLRDREVANQDSASSWGVVTLDEVAIENLASVVQASTIPLFEAFGFYQPTLDFVKSEIRRFLKL